MKTHYPTGAGKMYPIKDMSKGYLANTIAYIKRTKRNLDYLPYLEKKNKKKQLITFTLLL